jgi:hypothetical protein
MRTEQKNTENVRNPATAQTLAEQIAQAQAQAQQAQAQLTALQAQAQAQARAEHAQALIDAARAAGLGKSASAFETVCAVLALQQESPGRQARKRASVSARNGRETKTALTLSFLRGGAHTLAEIVDHVCAVYPEDSRATITDTTKRRLTTDGGRKYLGVTIGKDGDGRYSITA